MADAPLSATFDAHPLSHGLSLTGPRIDVTESHSPIGGDVKVYVCGSSRYSMTMPLPPPMMTSPLAVESVNAQPLSTGAGRRVGVPCSQKGSTRYYGRTVGVWRSASLPYGG